MNQKAECIKKQPTKQNFLKKHAVSVLINNSILYIITYNYYLLFPNKFMATI